MKTNNKNILTEQIKAIIIYNFLNSYNILEGLVINEFQQSLSQCTPELKNRLYFIYGGKIGTYIDYINDVIKLNEIQFKVDEKFGDLKIIQIIKLNKEHQFIKKFITTIPSASRATINFDFQDSIIKLTNMRNILSHELSSCTFKDKDIIEILSNEKINSLSYDFLSDFDINIIDDSTKSVLSNFYYMQIIINNLSN